VRDRQTCVGCGKKSPETETNYTLISAQFGWRLTRYQGPDGSLVVEWRCPSCWRDFKRARTAATSPGSGPGGSPSPPPDAPLRTPAARRTPVAQPMTPFESLRLPVPDDSDESTLRRPLTPIAPIPPTPPSEPGSGRAAKPPTPRRGGSSE
jgi:hypothetical protein